MEFGLFAFYVGKVLQTLFGIYAVLGVMAAFDYILVRYIEDHEFTIASILFLVLTLVFLKRINSITRKEEA